MRLILKVPDPIYSGPEHEHGRNCPWRCPNLNLVLGHRQTQCYHRSYCFPSIRFVIGSFVSHSVNQVTSFKFMYVFSLWGYAIRFIIVCVRRDIAKAHDLSVLECSSRRLFIYQTHLFTWRFWFVFVIVVVAILLRALLCGETENIHISTQLLTRKYWRVMQQ